VTSSPSGPDQIDVSELPAFNYGPGYRVYYLKRGNHLDSSFWLAETKSSTARNIDEALLLADKT